MITSTKTFNDQRSVIKRLIDGLPGWWMVGLVARAIKAVACGHSSVCVRVLVAMCRLSLVNILLIDQLRYFIFIFGCCKLIWFSHTHSLSATCALSCLYACMFVCTISFALHDKLFVGLKGKIRSFNMRIFVICIIFMQTIFNFRKMFLIDLLFVTLLGTFVRVVYLLHVCDSLVAYVAHANYMWWAFARRLF